MAIITVSRGSMSGGAAFAECLAAKLRYLCLSHEVLVQAAERIGVPEETLRSEIQGGGTRFWEHLSMKRRLYLFALQSALAEACLGGELVYHGYAGHLLLKDIPCVLRVRLIAPMAQRIRAVMERQGLNFEAAREYVRFVDQERIQWTKFVYGVDWKDPANYDLVINLRDVSIETACVMVSQAVKLASYAVTKDVMKKLRDFALVCRVRVALAQDARSHAVQFDIRADDGKVEVFGESSPDGGVIKWRGPSDQEIHSIVKTVAGVKEAVVSLHADAALSKA